MLTTHTVVRKPEVRFEDVINGWMTVIEGAEYETRMESFFTMFRGRFTRRQIIERAVVMREIQ